MKNKLPTVKYDYLLDGSNLNKLLITLFIIVVSIVVFLLYKRKKQARRSIMLMGLCDSGKTLIFSQILHSTNVSTHTSIKENVEEYLVNDKSLQVVDIPGHERMRDKFFDQYKAGARGIIFVIDSSTLQKKVRDVAEYLYVILSDSTVASIKPRILILCNKQDDFLAKGSSVIRSLLEKELNTLRITKSSQLESVASTQDKKKLFLGNEDHEFDFSDVPQFHVEFAESQALDKDANSPVDLESLKKWLIKVA